MFHGGNGADGIDGAGVLVEVTTANTGDQGSIADTSFEIFSGNGFVGMGNQLHFQVPGQSGGLPVLHGTHHRPHIADDIEDTDLAFDGFGLGGQ